MAASGRARPRRGELRGLQALVLVGSVALLVDYLLAALVLRRVLPARRAPPHGAAPARGAPRAGGGADAASALLERVARPRLESVLAAPSELRIYVYPLPAAFNEAALRALESAPADVRAWYPPLRVEVDVHEALLRSASRTRDPEEADLFYVPVYASAHILVDNGEHGVDWPEGNRARAIAFVQRALEHVAGVAPHFNASGGRDHVLTLSYDFGRCLTHVPALAADGVGPRLARHAIVLSMFADGARAPGGRCHAHGQDVVIPPRVEAARLPDAAAVRGSARNETLLYFRGRTKAYLPAARRHDPVGADCYRGRAEPANACGAVYSAGVRQLVVALHAGRAGFEVSSTTDAQVRKSAQSHADASAAMLRARHCLCAAGLAPWSPRLVEALAHGCTPLFTSLSPPAELLPFGELVDWRALSDRVDASELAALPAALAALRAREGAPTAPQLGLASSLMRYRGPGPSASASAAGRARGLDAHALIEYSLRPRAACARVRMRHDATLARALALHRAELRAEEAARAEQARALPPEPPPPPFRWAAPGASVDGVGARSDVGGPGGGLGGPHGLKLYVYALPSEYNRAFVASNPKCSSHMFSWDVYLHARLMADGGEEGLATGVRTENASEADLFFVPVYTMCNFNARGLAMQELSRPLVEGAIAYIASAHPWWARHGGRDHVFALPGDYGGCFTYRRAPSNSIPRALRSSVLLQTYGEVGRPCYAGAAATVVVPAVASNVAFRASARGVRPRTTLAYFRGDCHELGGGGGGGAAAEGGGGGGGNGSAAGGGEAGARWSADAYTAGLARQLFSARAQLVRHWAGRDPRVRIECGRASRQQYLLEMAQSTFCLAPRGWAPWSARLFEALEVGCIPVLLADGIVLPFAQTIDWSSIAVVLPEGRVDALLDHLEAISPERVRRMQGALAALRPSLLFSWPPAPCDAYELTLLSLARLLPRVSARGGSATREFVRERSARVAARRAAAGGAQHGGGGGAAAGGGGGSEDAVAAAAAAAEAEAEAGADAEAGGAADAGAQRGSRATPDASAARPAPGARGAAAEPPAPARAAPAASGASEPGAPPSSASGVLELVLLYGSSCTGKSVAARALASFLAEGGLPARALEADALIPGALYAERRRAEEGGALHRALERALGEAGARPPPLDALSDVRVQSEATAAVQLRALTHLLPELWAAHARPLGGGACRALVVVSTCSFLPLPPGARAERPGPLGWLRAALRAEHGLALRITPIGIEIGHKEHLRALERERGFFDEGMRAAFAELQRAYQANYSDAGVALRLKQWGPRSGFEKHPKHPFARVRTGLLERLRGPGACGAAAADAAA